MARICENGRILALLAIAFVGCSTGQNSKNGPISGTKERQTANQAGPAEAAQLKNMTAEELTAASRSNPRAFEGKYLRSKERVVVVGHVFKVETSDVIPTFFLQGTDGSLVNVFVSKEDQSKRIQPGQKVVVSGGVGLDSDSFEFMLPILTQARFEEPLVYKRPESVLPNFVKFTPADLVRELNLGSLEEKYFISKSKRDGSLTPRLIIEGSVEKVEPPKDVPWWTVELTGEISCLLAETESAEGIKVGQTITLVGNLAIATKETERFPAIVSIDNCYVY